eukprot:TRINITY_DN15692_c0_g2_i1.p1 TRINITY_DN15692_c0_g2~~TRINITY_DN15692_c0_g2_i1.p1  ORF type:complete len:213 (+),score=27.33 TRINITY_DN15692_c0_g2_i1:90-728(+)
MPLSLARAGRIVLLWSEEETFSSLQCIQEVSLMIALTKSTKLTLLPLKLPVILTLAIGCGMFPALMPYLISNFPHFLGSPVSDSLCGTLLLVPYAGCFCLFVHYLRQMPDQMRAQLSSFNQASTVQASLPNCPIKLESARTSEGLRRSRAATEGAAPDMVDLWKTYDRDSLPTPHQRTSPRPTRIYLRDSRHCSKPATTLRTCSSNPLSCRM